MTTPIYNAGSLGDLQTLLRGLNLLGQDVSTSGDAGSADPGASALESVTSSATKVVGTIATALGITTASFAAAASKFWKDNGTVHGDVVWGLSVVAGASALALALVVLGDLRARAQGQEAMYSARQAITVEFLRKGGQSASSDASSPAPNGGSSSAAPVTAQQVALIALAAAGRPHPVVVGGRAATLRGVTQAGAAVRLYVQFSRTEMDWVDLNEVAIGDVRYTAAGTLEE